MKKIIKFILPKKKKVELKDVAAPKPSRAAARVLNDALERAYKDQQAISRKAASIRTN